MLMRMNGPPGSASIGHQALDDGVRRWWRIIEKVTIIIYLKEKYFQSFSNLLHCFYFFKISTILTGIENPFALKRLSKIDHFSFVEEKD